MSTRSTGTDLTQTKRLLEIGSQAEAIVQLEKAVLAPPPPDSGLFFPDKIVVVTDQDPPTKDGGDLHPVPDPVFGIGGDPFPIEGTNGDDELHGSEYDDIINAHGGDDDVYGGDDHDAIDLGDGNDYALGEGGNDWIQGGAGNDNILGDFVDADGTPLDGNDFLDGGSGNDILYGAGGDDNLFGGSGTDFLDGEDGDDVLIGTSGGTDEMYGGAGADSFVSFDNSQQHNVWDYSADEGDMVEGDFWTYNAVMNVTEVHLNNGQIPFLLHDYNAGVSGINLIAWNPEPSA